MVEWFTCSWMTSTTFSMSTPGITTNTNSEHCDEDRPEHICTFPKFDEFKVSRGLQPGHWAFKSRLSATITDKEGRFSFLYSSLSFEKDLQVFCASFLWLSLLALDD